MKITDKDLRFIQGRQQINKYAYIILGVFAALFIAVVLYLCYQNTRVDESVCN